MITMETVAQGFQLKSTPGQVATKVRSILVAVFADQSLVAISTFLSGPEKIVGT